MPYGTNVSNTVQKFTTPTICLLHYPCRHSSYVYNHYSINYIGLNQSLPLDLVLNHYKSKTFDEDWLVHNLPVMIMPSCREFHNLGVLHTTSNIAPQNAG